MPGLTLGALRAHRSRRPRHAPPRPPQFLPPSKLPCDCAFPRLSPAPTSARPTERRALRTRQALSPGWRRAGQISTPGRHPLSGDERFGADGRETATIAGETVRTTSWTAAATAGIRYTAAGTRRAEACASFAANQDGVANPDGEETATWRSDEQRGDLHRRQVRNRGGTFANRPPRIVGRGHECGPVHLCGNERGSSGRSPTSFLLWSLGPAPGSLPSRSDGRPLSTRGSP
jgi:hypothetical protein